MGHWGGSMCPDGTCLMPCIVRKTALVTLAAEMMVIALFMALSLFPRVALPGCLAVYCKTTPYTALWGVMFLGYVPQELAGHPLSEACRNLRTKADVLAACRSGVS